MERRDSGGKKMPVVTGLTKTGKLALVTPFVLAVVILMASYVANSGMFINPFSEMLWSVLVFSATGLMIAGIMGKIGIRKQ